MGVSVSRGVVDGGEVYSRGSKTGVPQPVCYGSHGGPPVVTPHRVASSGSSAGVHCCSLVCAVGTGHAVVVPSNGQTQRVPQLPQRVLAARARARASIGSRVSLPVQTSCALGTHPTSSVGPVSARERCDAPSPSGRRHPAAVLDSSARAPHSVDGRTLHAPRRRRSRTSRLRGRHSHRRPRRLQGV